MLSICKRALGGLALAAALVVAPMAGSDAGTSTASLSVSVAVVNNCKVTAGALTFPNYVSGQTSPGTANANLSYTGCPNETVLFELSNGANAQASSRGLKSPAGAILAYQLYRNATFAAVAGTGTSGISFVAPASGNGTVTIYGQVPGGQSVASGNYTDAVGIVLTF